MDASPFEADDILPGVPKCVSEIQTVRNEIRGRCVSKLISSSIQCGSDPRSIASSRPFRPPRRACAKVLLDPDHSPRLLMDEG